MEPIQLFLIFGIAVALFGGPVSDQIRDWQDEKRRKKTGSNRH